MDEEANEGRKSDKSIKWIGAYNFTTKKIAVSLKCEGHEPKDFEFEGESFAQGKTRLPIDTRFDTKNDKGRWVVHRASSTVASIGCFGLGYKVRIAGDLMRKVGEAILKVDEHETMGEKELSGLVKPSLKGLVDKFKNMADVDKATKAIELSEKVIDKASNNLNMLVNNMDDLDRLNEKSKKTVDGAMQFQKNTNEVKKEMIWLNRKRCVYMTLTAGSIGGFLWFFFL